MKRTIKLTESDLRRIVTESVRRMVNEHWTDEEGLGGNENVEFSEDLWSDLMDEKLDEIKNAIHEGDYQYAYELTGKFLSELSSKV